MIYVGYQGIGKSTVCKKYDNCIDLESIHFYINDERSPDWYKIYVNLAIDLNNQGNDVFISSHKCVRSMLHELEVPFIVICPALELEKQWILKLTQRFEETRCVKDYRAVCGARTQYTENIKDLLTEEKVIIIDDTDYDLSKLIKLNKKKH